MNSCILYANTTKENLPIYYKVINFFFRLCFFFLKLNINNFLISKKTHWEKSIAGLLSSLHAVLALVVPAQIHFALEALGTNVTSKRFEARVLPAVGDEVGALAERFAAHLALVWLFTCRSDHSLCEGAANPFSTK